MRPVKPKYKTIILITLAAITMAALAYVNSQQVRDTQRPRIAALHQDVETGSSQWFDGLDRTRQEARR